MHTLPEAFAIASIFGIWQSTKWKSSAAVRWFFGLYTFLNVSITFLLLLAQFIALIVLTESINDFAEASYVFLAGFNGLVKGITLLWRGSQVNDLVELLLEKQCLPQNTREERICSHYNKVARYTTLCYVSLVALSSSATSVWPLFFSAEEYTLQVKAWYPYRISSDPVYWFTYVHQALGILIGAAWNATNDTIIAGFMMQTCAQLDLVSSRLRDLPEISRTVARHEVHDFEKRLVAQSVRHHSQIFKIAKDVSSIFAPCIFTQFCLSLVILCITIYELTAKGSNTLPVSFLLIFLSSMLVELFLYCWFGNEVTLKSLSFSKDIIESDWTELQVSTLKGFLIIMKRTTSPILMTCGPFITLSLNSYMSILKLSYSVFNVLKSS